MADGNVPASPPKLTPQELLDRAERSLLRLHEDAETFSSSVDTLTAGIDEWAKTERPSGMKERVMQMNQESERHLGESRKLREETREAVTALRGASAEFSRLSPDDQQAVVSRYTKQVEDLEQKSRVLEEAGEHFGNVQSYLHQKADALDNYLDGAGETLRELGNTAAKASAEAQELAQGTFRTGQQKEDLAGLKAKIKQKAEAGEHSPEVDARFAQAERDLKQLQKKNEKERQELIAQYKRGVQQFEEVNPAASDERGNYLHAHERELNTLIGSANKINEDLESQMMRLRYQQQRTDLDADMMGQIAAKFAEDADTMARWYDNEVIPRFTTTKEDAETSLQQVLREAEQTKDLAEPVEQKNARAVIQEARPVSPTPQVNTARPFEITDSSQTVQEPISPQDQVDVAAALKAARDQKKAPLSPAPAVSPFEMVDETTGAHQPADTVSAVEEATIADALAELRKTQPLRAQTVETTPTQESVVTEKGTANAAAIASAIQETLNPVSQNPLSPAPAPAETSSEKRLTATEEQIIREARAELKEKYADRRHNAEILTLYQERMRTRGWEYLQTHNTVQYEQLTRVQAQFPTIVVDASIFLPGDGQETVQLSALADVRATFPDVTDELLSILLLKQSLQVLQQAQAANREEATRALAAVLGQGALASLGAARGGKTPTLFAALGEQTNATREALAQEEAAFAERKQILQSATPTASPTPGTAGPQTVGASSPERLRAQQQQGLQKRRALQGALHNQLQRMQLGQALVKHLLQDQANPGASQTASSLLGVLLAEPGLAQSSVLDPRNARTQTSVAGPNVDAATSAIDQAAYEAALAGKLASQQLADRRLAETGGSSSQTSGASGVGSGGAPLLAIAQKPSNAREAFALAQQRMTANTQQLIGAGVLGGGLEASLSERNDATYGNADVIQLEANDFDTETANTNAVLTEQQEEQERQENQRLVELLREQDRVRLEQDQNHSLLEGVQKARQNGLLNKQTLQQGAKLLSNPYILALAALLLIVWLNIRLFFSKEDSAWRKPLGSGGKVATISLDLFFGTSFAITLTLTILITLLPFLLGMLALGGAFGTIQGALRIFSGH